jgi:hypothetical protein
VISPRPSGTEALGTRDFPLASRLGVTLCFEIA